VCRCPRDEPQARFETAAEIEKSARRSVSALSEGSGVTAHRGSEVGLSESGDALIAARWIEDREVQWQGLSYPKSLGRVVCQIIVGQAMDKRSQPVGLDSRKDCRKRLPVEMDLELRHRMRSNRMVSHFTNEDDEGQVTQTLRGLQFRVELVSRRAIGCLVVDVSMKGRVRVSHSSSVP